MEGKVLRVDFSARRGAPTVAASHPTPEAEVRRMDDFVLKRMRGHMVRGEFVSFFSRLSEAEQILGFEIPWLAHDLEIADEDIADWALGKKLPKSQRILMVRIFEYLKNKKEGTKRGAEVPHE